MKNKVPIILLLLNVLVTSAQAQLPPVFAGDSARAVQQEIPVRKYLSPVRILWKT